MLTNGSGCRGLFPLLGTAEFLGEGQVSWGNVWMASSPIVVVERRRGPLVSWGVSADTVESTVGYARGSARDVYNV